MTYLLHWLYYLAQQGMVTCVGGETWIKNHHCDHKSHMCTATEQGNSREAEDSGHQRGGGDFSQTPDAVFEADHSQKPVGGEWALGFGQAEPMAQFQGWQDMHGLGSRQAALGFQASGSLLNTAVFSYSLTKHRSKDVLELIDAQLSEKEWAH